MVQLNTLSRPTITIDLARHFSYISKQLQLPHHSFRATAASSGNLILLELSGWLAKISPSVDILTISLPGSPFPLSECGESSPMALLGLAVLGVGP
jgi:hypothetical protein